MSDQELKYSARGVSAAKEDVHEAITKLDKGLYEHTFCKIFPDYLAGEASFCNIMSSDGTGTKSILAYLYWKSTGDLSVWEGIAQDAIVMNLDDLLCVGGNGKFLYSSILNRNKHLIPGEVIKAIIEGGQKFFESMHEQGIEIIYTGGETADLGDLVRTITVDGSMVCRMKKEDLILNQNIAPGDAIVGLASYGQAVYEQTYNSGIGSNGLTSARHDVLHKSLLEAHPESFDPHTNKEVLYTGSKQLTDRIGEDLPDVGKLLLSPTRTYAPVLRKLSVEMGDQIHGLVHCTGGGQTKVLHFIDRVHVIKDQLLPTPPVFDLIRNESGSSWKEMYKVFNMGHRMEVYLPEQSVDEALNVIRSFDIDCQVIGRVEKAEKAKVTVLNEHGSYEYE